MVFPYREEMSPTIEELKRDQSELAGWLQDLDTFVDAGDFENALECAKRIVKILERMRP